MKEVICYICHEGTKLLRHDNHVMHSVPIACERCQAKVDPELRKFKGISTKEEKK